YLAFARRVSSHVVQAQYLPQRIHTTCHERQMIQKKIKNQTPLQTFSHQQADRFCGTTNDSRLHNCTALKAELTPSAAQAEPLRQIAIGACQIGRHRLSSRCDRTEITIDKR